jgi:hypothetical protein
MVSVDHFRQELRAWMSAAAANGAIDILVNGGELCRALRENTTAMDACGKAMKDELRPGDIVIIDAGAGAGLTIRYLLPRVS